MQIDHNQSLVLLGLMTKSPEVRGALAVLIPNFDTLAGKALCLQRFNAWEYLKPFTEAEMAADKTLRDAAKAREELYHQLCPFVLALSKFRVEEL